MDTKRCNKCGKEFEIADFNFKSKSEGKRASYCKFCQKEYSAKHYEDNKQEYLDRNRRQCKRNMERIVEYLQSHPCTDCGEKDPVVLDFDHLRDKHMCVVMMAHRRVSWENVEKEIAKCVVRCANCHRRKTAKTLGWKYKMAP